MSTLDFTKSCSDELVREGVRQWEGIIIDTFLKSYFYLIIMKGTKFKATLVHALYEKYLKKFVILSLRLSVQRSKLRDNLLQWKHGDARGMITSIYCFIVIMYLFHLNREFGERDF